MNTQRTNLDSFKQRIAALHNDESGATATEYVIILVLVACFVIAAVKAFGSTVSDKYGSAQKGVAGIGF